MANQIVSPFILPNEYERKIAEVKRREAMAKMLAQQQYQPLEGSAAPTPSYAPLVQGLQSYLLARELKKGQEAKDAATELEGQSARQISGRLQGGRPSEPTLTGMESQPVKDFYQMRGQMAEPILLKEYERIEAEKNAPMPKNPTVDDLQPVIPTAQYTRSPSDALGVASTSAGQAALQNRPFLGAQLAEALKPVTKKFSATPFIATNGLTYTIDENTGRATPLTDAAGAPITGTPKQASTSSERKLYDDLHTTPDSKIKEPFDVWYEKKEKSKNPDSNPDGTPFSGKGITAQYLNILINGDTNSKQYALAYNAVSKPHVSFDPETGQTVTIPGMDLSQFAKPNVPVVPNATGMTPQITDDPTQTKAAIQARSTLKDFDKLFEQLKQSIAIPTNEEKLQFSTLGVKTPNISKSITAYNAMVSILRNKEILNTGVLQTGELKWLNTFLTDPATIKGMLSGDESTLEGFRSFRALIESKAQLGKGKNKTYNPNTGKIE